MTDDLLGTSCRPDEARTIYDVRSDRFVVTLCASYPMHDEVPSAEHALAWALGLTRDGASEDTYWFVYDRWTQEGRFISQEEVVDIMEKEGADV